MIVAVDELLADLEALTPGLDSPLRLTVEQGYCVAFVNGEAVTFNGGVLCRKKTALAVNGAFDAGPMIRVLRFHRRRKFVIREEETQVTFTNKRDQIEFNLKKEHAGDIVRYARKVPRPGEWKPFPRALAEALRIGYFSVDPDGWYDESRFHFTPDGVFVIGKQRTSVMKFRLKTGIGKSGSVDAALLKRIITSLAPRRFAAKAGWIYFENRPGGYTACRFVMDGPQDWARRLAFPFKGHLVRFSEETRGACDVAGKIADTHGGKQVTVRLAHKKLRIRGKNPTEHYEEKVDVRYKGPAVTFSIDPDVLQWIVSEHTEALISPESKMLKVVRADWEYVLRVHFKQ